MENKTDQTNAPKSVKIASYMIYLSIIIGIINSVLYETLGNQEMLSNPKSLIVGIVVFLIIGVIGFQIGRGKNWARIVLLILTVIGIVGLPAIIVDDFLLHPAIGILSIVQTLIQLYVVIILFSGNSKRWFNRKKTIETTPNTR